MISVPILTSRKVEGTGYSGISERTEYYTIAKHLLMSAGDAMERLMTAYKVLRPDFKHFFNKIYARRKSWSSLVIRREWQICLKYSTTVQIQSKGNIQMKNPCYFNGLIY